MRWRHWHQWPLWLRLWAAITVSLLGGLLLVAAIVRYALAPQLWDPAEEERRALWRELRAEQRAELRAAWATKVLERFPERFPGGAADVPPPPQWSGGRRRSELELWQWLLIVAAGVALATYPVARGLTRRLERLSVGVESLGQGDLRARVAVEGDDEVADLARRFNAAAQRIESLVQGHKELLAHTSHELRTPLTRLRLRLESPVVDPTLRDHARQELDELNALIDQLLLASRLDHAPDALAVTAVDLLGIVAEEGARTGADVEGEPTIIQGDDALLRRMVRNLLENALRHAPQTSAEVRVRQGPGVVLLTVADHGPGVAEADRERIFEPFYRAPGAAAGGSGLGLALVQRIVSRHGGTVRCRARPDGPGSVFEVSLPRTIAGASARA